MYEGKQKIRTQISFSKCMILYKQKHETLEKDELIKGENVQIFFHIINFLMTPQMNAANIFQTKRKGVRKYAPKLL